MEKQNEKYYLGLDIGTSSVGWCVANQDYDIIHSKKFLFDIEGNLIKKSGAHLWGSRLFNEANDAKTRRQNRTNRRRLARRRWRINLLRDIFRDEINKIDPLFFDRLDNSFYFNEDKPKEIQNCSFLFNDYKLEKEFHRNYKTIHHLRKDLLEHDTKNGKPFDIRLIYLVLAHMIKYRGNFLTNLQIDSNNLSVENFDNSIKQMLLEDFKQIDDLISQIVSKNEVYNFKKLNFSNEDIDEIVKVFQKEKRISFLKDELFKKNLKIKLAVNNSEPSISELYKNVFLLIFGSESVKYKCFMNDDNIDNEDSKNLIKFSSDSFDEDINSMNLDDDYYQLILTAKKIYINKNLIALGGSITKAMVNIYDEHQKQLRYLKDLIYKYDREDFKSFFYEYAPDSYAGYIGYSNYKRKRVRKAHGKIEDVTKRVKDILNKINQNQELLTSKEKEEYYHIDDAISKGNLFPRQNSKINGIWPYQLNEVEMRQIIEKHKKYYPFLAEKDKEFLCFNNELEYKLVSILRFKIPYYVGPLSIKNDNSHGWITKKEGKENVRITPYNFSEVIDLSKTNETFIKRMVNKCTYIFGEEALPKFSLYYQAYKVLNALNNIVINDEPFSKELKDYLLDSLYLVDKNITKNKFNEKLKKFYKDKDFVCRTRNGKDIEKEFYDNNLSAYVDFISIFGKEFYFDRNKFRLVEEIIKLITIVEDKELLKQEIKILFDKNRDCIKDIDDIESAIKKIANFNYSKWSPFSKKLLVDLRDSKNKLINPITAEEMNANILEVLYLTNDNFMEIYSSLINNYDFKEQVDDLNSEAQFNGVNELIEECRFSPKMKRGLIQTFKLIDELKKYMTKNVNSNFSGFDKIFVECTREKQESKRTISRLEKLKDFYNAAKKLVEEESVDSIEHFSKVENELNSKTDSDLRVDKVFLYFMQLGRSVYTGKEISLNELTDSNTSWDIDHIIPQALVKDDSFINRVLVEKDINNTKGRSYPLTSDILKPDGKKWVKILNKIQDKNSSLMPNIKKERILRIKELTEEEKIGFVNSQISTTNWTVKAVCDILKQTEKSSKIVYSKAGLVTDFRKFFDIVKIRDLNNFHHAHDAYLNIVVGNVYDNYFGGNYLTVKAARERFKNFQTNDEDEVDSSSNKQPILKATVKYIFVYDRKINGNYYWKAKDYVIEITEDGKIKFKSKYGRYIESENSNKEATIDKIRKYLSYNDVLVTHRTYTQKGDNGLFNHISIMTAESQKAKIPLKLSNDKLKRSDRYGGYSDLCVPFYFLVKSIKKGSTFKYTLEYIPAVYLDSYKKNDKLDLSKVERYFKEERRLSSPKIILSNLLIKTIIKRGKLKLGIQSSTGEKSSSLKTVNFNEFILPDINLGDDNAKVTINLLKYCKNIFQFLGTNDDAFKKKDLFIYWQKAIKNPKTNLGNSKSEEYIITYNKNKLFFEYLVNNILNKQVYTELPELSNFVNKVLNNKDKFTELNTFEQVVLIANIIILLSYREGGNIKFASNNEIKEENYMNLALTNIGKKFDILSAGQIRINRELKSGDQVLMTSLSGLYITLLYQIPGKIK